MAAAGNVLVAEARKFLDTITCAELVAAKKLLVTISADATIQQCFDYMTPLGILSLVVMPANDDEKKEVSKSDVPFLGIIDTMDILLYVAFGNFKIQNEPSKDSLSGKNLERLKVRDLMGAFAESQSGYWNNGLYVVKGEQSLLSTLDLFVGGVRRVIVKLPSGDYKVLSQSDALRAVASQCDKLEPIAKQSLKKAGLLKEEEFNKLVIIKPKTSALTAFRKLIMNSVDAAALVNDDGKIIGNISASDLRYIFRVDKDLCSLFLPTVEFLKHVHAADLLKPIISSTNETVFESMNKCIIGKIHRVWAVNEKDEPIVAVRIQDFLVKFSELDYKHD